MSGTCPVPIPMKGNLGWVNLGYFIQEQPEVASVYQRNKPYSILALTDSSGKVSERYAYTAYGQPTFLNASATVQTSSAAGNRYTYTAREWDATLGLHHFRARWMSGLTGRFLTRDPIKYFAGMNIYAFIANNPLHRIDPSGLYWDEPEPKKVDVKAFCNRYRSVSIWLRQCEPEN